MPKVLVVDDHEDLVTLTAEFLAAEGWAVVMARDAEEAIERAMLEPVDVVLTDVLLGRATGVELEAAFKARPSLRQVPFVFMTGHAPHADQLGPGRALLKPFSLDDLRSLLKRVLLERVGTKADPQDRP